MKNKYFTIVFCVIVVVFFANSGLQAQQPGSPITLPNVTLDFDTAKEPGDLAVPLQILALMTVLSLAPAILILMTSFTRIIIIFHFIRQAIGTQQMPSNQILVGLALFLTFFIMTPVWQQVNIDAIQPYLSEEISDAEAFEKGLEPVRKFMINLTREKDIALFMRFAQENKPETVQDIPLQVIVPAFVVSELRIAFQIGFLLYIPFLMIDMVVASILMSMGMLMLPPIMISLPFKVLLFVLVDGWFLIINSIVTSFTP